MAPEAEEQYPEYRPPARIAPTPAPPGGVSADDLNYVATHKPFLSEVGAGHLVYRGRKVVNPQTGRSSATTPDRRSSHTAHGFADCGHQLEDRPVQRHAHHRSRPFCGGQDDRSHDRLGQGHGGLPGGLGRACGWTFTDPQAHQHGRPLVRADRRFHQPAQGQQVQGATGAQVPWRQA